MMDVLTQIGNVLGVPACIACTWAVFTIKSMLTRIAKVEQDNELLKGVLSDIRSDVSYIKGKIDGGN